jgi:RimJ/RimL family protein N-acetyltransferase
MDEDNQARCRALQQVGYRNVGVYWQHRFRGGVWGDGWLAGLSGEDWTAHHSACHTADKQARSGNDHGPVQE